MVSIRSTPSAYTWIKEKMSRVFTASQSACRRAALSANFRWANHFSVYLAVMKSFLTCLRHNWRGKNEILNLGWFFRNFYVLFISHSHVTRWVRFGDLCWQICLHDLIEACIAHTVSKLREMKSVLICMFASSLKQEKQSFHESLPRAQTCPEHPVSVTVFWRSEHPFPDGFQSIRYKSTHPGLWRAMLDLEWQHTKIHWHVIWISHPWSQPSFMDNNETSSAGLTRSHRMCKEKLKGQIRNRKCGVWKWTTLVILVSCYMLILSHASIFLVNVT